MQAWQKLPSLLKWSAEWCSEAIASKAAARGELWVLLRLRPWAWRNIERQHGAGSISQRSALSASYYLTLLPDHLLGIEDDLMDLPTEQMPYSHTEPARSSEWWHSGGSRGSPPAQCTAQGRRWGEGRSRCPRCTKRPVTQDGDLIWRPDAMMPEKMLDYKQ